MSLDYDIRPGLIHLRARGALSLAQLLETFALIHDHPLFDPRATLFADFRQTQAADLDHEAVQKLARSALQLDSSSLRVILVDDRLNFGIARAYQSYLALDGQAPARVFTTFVDAQALLAQRDIYISDVDAQAQDSGEADAGAPSPG